MLLTGGLIAFFLFFFTVLPRAVLGTTVDRVVREAACDVLVERIGGDGIPESILLPTAGGPHAEYAAEVARAIVRTTGAEVTIQHVVPPDADATRRDRATAAVDETADRLEGVRHETDVIAAPDVLDAIVEASADHDLTIIGATREGLFQRLVFGSLPERVGREASGTVIMAKRNFGVASHVRRLIGRE